MSTKSKHRSSAASTHPYTLIPLVLVLLILPVISYLHLYDPELSGYDWFPNTNLSTDLFLYCKSIVFIALSTIMLIQVVYRSIKDRKFVAPKIYLPLAIYAVLAFLSCAFSSYRNFAFNGSYEQFESFWVLLGYCITAYYAYLMVQDEDDLRFLMRFFVAGIVLSTLIGLSQAAGHNFWFTSFGKMLRIPANLRDSVETSAAFENNRVYMSLYNPNYVGLYCVLIIPILLMLAFPEKSTKSAKLPPAARTALYLVLAAALAFCLVMSGAKNGLLALGIALLFSIIFLMFRYRKRWYLSLGALVCLGALFFLADSLLGHGITNALKSIVSAEKTVYDLQDIAFDGDNVTITYKGNPLIISLHTDKTFTIQDADGNTPAMENTEDQTYLLTDSRFSPMSISFLLVGDRLGIGVTCQNTTWYFCHNGEQVVFLSPAGKWCTFEAAPSAVFTGHEAFFTGRGYIWSRTIPLLKNYLFLGSGADTFTLIFPNNDFVGKYNSSFSGQIITKPHSMYLQIFVQTGMLSLIAVLVFYLWYFFSSCRIYFTHRLDSYSARIGLGIFIGTIGYMTSSIVNDSTVTVAPLFWAMMGLGICINQKILKINNP